MSRDPFFSRLRLASTAGAGATDARYCDRTEVATWDHGLLLLAQDIDLDRAVLLKTIQGEPAAAEDAVRRLLDEARTAGGLQHPGVPPVYDLALDAEGRPFFSMRHVHGRTLEDLLRGQGDAQEGRHRLLGILEFVCQTLAFAHERGVVHGGLTSRNVLAGDFGEVQVLDWSHAGLVEAGADPRTDLQAVGGLLHDILSSGEEGDSALADLGRAALDSGTTLDMEDLARELGRHLVGTEERAHRARLQAVADEEEAAAARLRHEQARLQVEQQRKRKSQILAFSLAVGLGLILAALGWTWLEVGRRERERNAHAVVEAAMREATTARVDQRWDRALEAASGAVTSSRSEGVSADLRAEAARLEGEIRVAAASARDARERAAREERLAADLARASTRSDLDPAEANERAWRDAFATYGIDLSMPDAEAVARRIATDPLRDRLVDSIRTWRAAQVVRDGQATPSLEALAKVLHLDAAANAAADAAALEDEAWLHPDDEERQLAAGRALRAQGVRGASKAVWHLTAAVAVGEDRAGLQVHLGDAWRAARRPVLAREAYESAANLDPDWDVPRARIDALGGASGPR